MESAKIFYHALFTFLIPYLLATALVVLAALVILRLLSPWQSPLDSWWKRRKTSGKSHTPPTTNSSTHSTNSRR